MKSSLSSPITAINAPVASLRISLSLSAIELTPAGVENLVRPSETRPDAVTLRRCPLRTTRPVFVQPLLALSALTLTLIVKNLVAALVDSESFGREFDAIGSDCVLGDERVGCDMVEGPLFCALVSSV